MKKSIISAMVILSTANAFATTITCQVGDPKTSGTQKIVKSEDLKKSIEAGNLLEKGDTKYLLTISDIYEDQDNSKIISKDAMVLTTVVGGKASQNMVSDGNNLMYFDNNNAIAMFCKRTN